MVDAGWAARVLAALERSWSPASSSQWSRDNVARGQCNATAIVINARFGGDILKTRVAGAWHFYNRLDGSAHDFTAAQFASPPRYDDIPASVADACEGTSKEQVEALAQRFVAAFREAR